jgi:hypothetical protein
MPRRQPQARVDLEVACVACDKGEAIGNGYGCYLAVHERGEPPWGQVFNGLLMR